MTNQSQLAVKMVLRIYGAPELKRNRRTTE